MEKIWKIVPYVHMGNSDKKSDDKPLASMLETSLEGAEWQWEGWKGHKISPSLHRTPKKTYILAHILVPQNSPPNFLPLHIHHEDPLLPRKNEVDVG